MSNTANFHTVLDWTISMSSPELVAARSQAARDSRPAPIPEGAIVAEADSVTGKLTYRFIRVVKRCHDQGDAVKEAHAEAKYAMTRIAPWGLGTDFDDIKIDVSVVK